MRYIWLGYCYGPDENTMQIIVCCWNCSKETIEVASALLMQEYAYILQKRPADESSMYIGFTGVELA